MFRQLTNLFYKYYLWMFQPTKIIEEIKKRSGSCKRCGKCCYWFGKIRCPLLNKNNKCRINSFKPFFCAISPLHSDMEKRESKKISCGYSYEEWEEQNV